MDILLEYLQNRQAKHQLEVEDLFSQIKRIDKVRLASASPSLKSGIASGMNCSKH